jgi:Xaa-Pro aminopeptidase
MTVVSAPTPEFALARLATVTEGVRDAGLAALVISADWKHRGNYRYLSGRVLWSRWAYIVIVPDREPILVVIAPSQQYWAKREGWIKDVRFVERPVEEVAIALRDVLKPGDRLGIAGLDDTMRVADYLYLTTELSGVEISDATGVVAQARARKTAAEFDSLRDSMRIAEEAFEGFCDSVRPGASHWALVGEAERTIRGQGCYDTMILLSDGPFLREPNNLIVRPGDVIMFSIELSGPDGYWVERGGTISIGQPSDRTRRLFDACYEVFVAIQPLLVPGAECGEIVRRVDSILSDSEFSRGIWGGHGIGLDVLEQPVLLPDSPQLIPSMQAIAYHPHVTDLETSHGAYLADTFEVDESGSKGLATLPHELFIID